MCHLVQHGFRAPLVGRAGDLAAEDVVLKERHRARVLHRTGVEFGNEQLVVLAERVGRAKVVVVEPESLLGLGEEPFVVHEFGERLAAEQPERNVAVVIAVGIVPAGVGARDQRHQIGTHPWGRGERVSLGGPVVLDAEGRAVGDHLPVRRRGDGDVERGLEVGLVETREHPLGVGGFEL